MLDNVFSPLLNEDTVMTMITDRAGSRTVCPRTIPSRLTLAISCINGATIMAYVADYFYCEIVNGVV